MTNASPTLILFDIDGTLLRPDGCGRAAFEAVLQELFGVAEILNSHCFAGNTDWQILRNILMPLGYTPEAVAEQLPAFAEAIARHLQAIVDRYDVLALPGALAFWPERSSLSLLRIFVTRWA